MYRSIRNFNIPPPRADAGNLNFLESGFSNSRHLGKKCVQMPHRHTENYDNLHVKDKKFPVTIQGI